MKKIAAVAGLVLLATFGATAAHGDGTDQHEVSEEQYETLLAQCRYAGTGKGRCRSTVKEIYRIGATDAKLDCRTYAGVSVCGTLKLSKAEQACIRDSVEGGISFRRAEVECYAFS
ncbi:hypothetical protein E1295_05845 [Nonomuraea mesophila]|uniref:Uncharacterized protein n=1 Tax=Nonomuraea mesophila TaxID=2530382 RepID=A0A4R5FUY6_9ACTN|nr:hypothetical protein [Nonomuraea mesophila]TDE58133.1 hypothetical protein E1295_05845 [Nonomuraea mesophila]